jgi:hypothetical protein
VETTCTAGRALQNQRSTKATPESLVADQENKGVEIKALERLPQSIMSVNLDL